MTFARILTATFFVLAGVTSAQAQSEVMINESFDAAEASSLAVSVRDADIKVETATDGEVNVKVMVAGRDMDRAAEYFEMQQFEVILKDEAVHIVSTGTSKSWTDWRNTPQITVHVQIPVTYPISIRTADGDVAVSRVENELHIKTADGDISVGYAAGGEMELRTSDGDIDVGALHGESIHAKTADGDINFGTVAGARIAVSTSDGDVNFGTLSGTLEVSTADGDIAIGMLQTDHSNLRTSDGDIHIRQIDGNVEVRAVDGDIVLELAQPGVITANTSDGDIVLHANEAHAADIQFSGDGVSIDSGFRFSGTLKDDSASGTVNGGGDLIKARSSDGGIRLRVLQR